MSVDTANVRNGGALIDSNGTAVTMAQALTHSIILGDNATDGGLTLNDTNATKGTLILSGANTYTGTTNVTAGTLQVTGSLTSAVQVGGSGTLSGEGSTTGAVTFAGGSSFVFDPTTTGAGQYFTAGGVINTTAGSGTKINLSLSPGVSSGTGIVVFQGSSITSNGVSDFRLLSRGSLSLTSTQLLFDYAAPASVVWKGGNATNPSFWDINTTTQNFTLGGVDNAFFNGDSVTFDDTASSTLVAIQGASMSPATVTFNNSSKNYTLSGGAIAGAATTVTKSGSGTLTLTSDNTYGGTTTLNAGTLRATSANALGAGSLSLAGGVLQLANDTALNFGRNTTVTGNTQITSDTLTAAAGVKHTLGTLNIGANTLTIAKGPSATGTAAGVTFGSITLTGAPVFDVGSNATLTLGALSGNFDITKQGAGTLVLAITGTRTGKTFINGGTLSVGLDVRLGTLLLLSSLETSPSTAAQSTLTGTICRRMRTAGS